MSKETDVVVIGAGPGGYAAAFLAADLGLKTMIVDLEENPGGACLYRGCIPSKALLHAAKLVNETKQAQEFGLTFQEPEIDIERLVEWKNGVIGKLTGGLGQLRKARKVKHVQGRASFIDNTTLAVEGSDETITFKHAIIATGSRPFIPGPLALDSERVMTSTEALELRDLPDSLLVIGGGYIGLEMGTVYSSLGSKVTVVEMEKRLLPGADADLVRVLARGLNERMHEILLGTRVVKMEETSEGITVTFDPERTETFDKVLISVGRRPNTENLGLENTKIELDAQGFVKCDGQGRTAESNIFAIGDISGQPMLAHRASHQGRLAARAIHGSKAVFEPHAIPAVIFTDPELAWAGVTEEEAKEADIPHKVARFPWGASGRALTLGRTDGLTKLILDPETERILGVGIVGPGAGELIAEGTLAIEMAATAEDLSLTIHAHPTLSETVMESADVFFGTATHVAGRR